MDNLARHFQSLDRVAVPDLWPEITRRAASSSGVPVRGASIAWGRYGSRSTPSLLRLGFVAVLLGIALMAGTFVAGSLLNGPVIVLPTPQLTATPTPTATAIPQPAEVVCSEASGRDQSGATAMPISISDTSGLVAACRKIASVPVWQLASASSDRIRLAWVVSGCDVAAAVMIANEKGELVGHVVQQRANPCAPGTGTAAIEFDLRGAVILGPVPTVEYVDVAPPSP